MSPIRPLIGIASARRPAILAETLDYLAGLYGKDVPIIVCVPSPEDAAGIAATAGVEIVTGPEGLTRQRNAILQAAIGRADLVLFFDDDFIPHPDFVTQMQRVFAREPDVVIATGRVLFDGILTRGFTLAQSVGFLVHPPRQTGRLRPVHNAYGCNMAVRLSIVARHHLAFDERLPLYGWLEDVDFSRVMARHGKSVHVDDAWGVHMGVRSGRQPGLRLGYSQVANPAYLAAKGTLSLPRAMLQIARNTLANIAGCLRGETGIDRRGRLCGNLLAFRDLCLGRADPGRVLDLQTGPRPPGGAIDALRKRSMP